MARNTVLRSMHDIGLAAWFGGSLMGAVALNAAAAKVDDPSQRSRVANAGWARWSPVNAVAIGAHLVGAVGLLVVNRDRVRDQHGVGASSGVKTALTVSAMGATAWSGLQGARMAKEGDVPVESGTSPTAGTPSTVAKAQQQLAALQWAIPALTGALIAVTSLQGEQQLPEEQAAGRLKRAAARLSS